MDITDKKIADLFMLDRELSEEIFQKYILHRNFDTYGHWLGDKRYLDKDGAFVSDLFELNPYYWGDREDVTQRPNFRYKGDNGFDIYWYKYPMRGAYSTRKLEKAEFMDAMESCRRYLGGIV